MGLARTAILLALFGWKYEAVAGAVSMIAYAALKRRFEHPYAGRRAILLWVLLEIAALIFTLLSLPPGGGNLTG